MIGVHENVLLNAKTEHVSQLGHEIKIKRDVLKLCLSFLYAEGSIFEDIFIDQFKTIKGNFKTKTTAINWYLNENPVDKYDNFKLIFDFDKYASDFGLKEIKIIYIILNYFDDQRIENILNSLPKDLERNEITSFEKLCNVNYIINDKHDLKQKLVTYLFDYDTFSSISKRYDAYQLTKNLNVDACLYCNRNYTITVEHGTKIIRPELDHFLPKYRYPLLAVSFYNLIPSCHICNSNLKGSKEFNLKDYFHPYLGSFDLHNVKFTYRPENAMAFFDGIDDGLTVKLDTITIKSNEIKIKIDNNIETFQLNAIYSFHEPIVKQLQELKRLSNSNYLTWIQEKIFIDKNNSPIIKEKKEIYQSVMLTYYDPSEYSKRPMAKFMKDIAVELGIIS